MNLNMRNILLVLLLISSACSSHRLIMSQRVVEHHSPFAAIMLALADGEDRRELQQALQRGPGAFEEALEAYWEKWDPTPGTEINEYRAMVEARYHIILNSGYSETDDCVVAFTIWGAPTRSSSRSALDNSFSWFYRASPEIERAGLNRRLLRRGTSFSLTFRQLAEGMPYRQMAGGSFSPPGALSRRQYERIERLLEDPQSSIRLKGAALWRLRAGPRGTFLRPAAPLCRSGGS